MRLRCQGWSDSRPSARRRETVFVGGRRRRWSRRHFAETDRKRIAPQTNRSGSGGLDPAAVSHSSFRGANGRNLHGVDRPPDWLMRAPEVLHLGPAQLAIPADTKIADAQAADLDPHQLEHLAADGFDHAAHLPVAS